MNTVEEKEKELLELRERERQLEEDIVFERFLENWRNDGDLKEFECSIEGAKLRTVDFKDKYIFRCKINSEVIEFNIEKQNYLSLLTKQTDKEEIARETFKILSERIAVYLLKNLKIKEFI